MKVRSLAAALALISSPAIAYANDFSGFSAAAELHLKSTGGEFSASEDGSSMSADLGGKQTTIGAINLAYAFALGSQLSLQIGATADLSETDLAKAEASDGIDSGTLSVKEKNHRSIYIAPGFNVTPKTIVYGKLAYHQMKAQYTETDGVDEFKLSKKFAGIGYGVGLKTMLTNNVFAYAEVQRVDYGKKKLSVDGEVIGKFEPSSTIGTVGVGYRF